MINNFDYNIEYKEEIEFFEKEIQLPENIKNLFIKKILFINKFRTYFDENNKHYKSYLIYDILTLIYHINNGTERTCKNYYRSLIENYLRVMLRLKDQDSTGVNDLFRKFKKLNLETNYLEISEYLTEEYHNGCNFVHSNIKAGLTIFEYYDEVIGYETGKKQNSEKLFCELNNLLSYMIRGIVLVYNNDLANIFYRRIDEIKFLAGEEMYVLFRLLRQKESLKN